MMIFVAVGGAVARGGTLAIRILDDAGSPASARVYLIDSKGRAYSPAGAVQYPNKLRDYAGHEQHFVPSGGFFTIELPAGRYFLEIERGKEFLPIHSEFTLSAAGNRQKTFQLKRWIRMADRGCDSGDMHVNAVIGDLGDAHAGGGFECGTTHL